jgi:hypothetical protein
MYQEEWEKENMAGDDWITNGIVIFGAGIAIILIIFSF